MKIAVIGSGISGLSAAWLLSCNHKVTLFEAEKRLGGHTHTVDVTVDGVTHPVDTGFLVYNDRTYPNLLALFEMLGVRWAESDMSFSVQAEAEGVEWAGTDLASVFAQKRNLLSPRFWGMLYDIVRFNREGTRLARDDHAATGTLGEFLAKRSYGQAFRDWYLIPMAAAIWSTPAENIRDFPLRTFLRFCHNHGLLQITDRPRWRTVVGGGREYVARMATAITEVRASTPVVAVIRQENGVLVTTALGREEHFDQVVLACHSDQALGLLADASSQERSILGAITYQPNVAVLHTDESFLPRNPKAWAAWNYHAGARLTGSRPVALSYLINKLQPLPFEKPVIVTLNPHRPPAPDKVQGTFKYSHPLFDEAAVAAQGQLDSIQGKAHVWFCGAWTRYGFHEDGLLSGIRVARSLGVHAPWQKVEVQKVEVQDE